MVITKNYLFAALLLLVCNWSLAQFSGSFQQLLEKDPLTHHAFGVANTPGTLERLLADKQVSVKSVTREWIFVQASPNWIYEAKQTGKITQYYYERSFPSVLNDSTLPKHKVDLVHAGLGGLPSAFTGKEVIIGYVDQGLDYTHPDFIDANGQTRVLYYWDHTLPFDAVRTPQPYNYGQLWYASDIQAAACGSNEEATAHGTSVAGAGSADGSANGKNKGVAPDSKIIIVETNFNLPNWTLTIADACDFIFDKADSLGLPAVVNLSLGSYLGSHDGNDPASILMEQLLDEQPGRIIVCAAGNSGTWGKYHAHGEVDADTSFVWFDNNPSGQLGPNTIYFDLWSDVADANWSYALAANLPSGTYDERAETMYRTATAGAGSGPIYDTLYNGGNRIATIELYPEIVGGNYHLEVFFSAVDSTTYKYAFKTTGSGNYDLWSGAIIGLNNIVQVIPTAAQYPPIIHYQGPDTLMTIVSSWNCSEKVVSVGNLRNRLGHMDRNNNYYQPAPTYLSAVGQLSQNSSKGPNRHGLIKPDISACGDVSLSAGPTWLLSNAAYNSLIDVDGWHVRNGGTSMASPVVAGIAALYLEKCYQGTYTSFINALHATGMTDAFTGVTPNNAYGYGKADALEVLLQSNYIATVDAPAQFCGSDSAFAVVPGTLDSILWNTGSTIDYSVLTGSGDVSFISYDDEGCIAYSDTVSVSMGDIPATPMITAAGNVLSTDPYPNLQWYENGLAMSGETGTSITITLPNTNDYTVVATGSTGCEVESAPYNASAGVEESVALSMTVYPNPTEGKITIQTEEFITDISVYTVSGSLVATLHPENGIISLQNLSPGTYLLKVIGESRVGWTKIVKK